MDFLFFNNSLYFLIFAVISGALIIWNIRKQGNGLTPAQAVILANREAAIFIDIRDHDAYLQGSIAQSRHVPADKLVERSASISEKKPLIIVADNIRLAEKAARQLKLAGRNNVYCLNGGLTAWRNENLPVKKSPANKNQSK